MYNLTWLVQKNRDKVDNVKMTTSCSHTCTPITESEDDFFVLMNDLIRIYEHTTILLGFYYQPIEQILNYQN